MRQDKSVSIAATVNRSRLTLEELLLPPTSECETATVDVSQSQDIRDQTAILTADCWWQLVLHRWQVGSLAAAKQCPPPVSASARMGLRHDLDALGITVVANSHQATLANTHQEQGPSAISCAEHGFFLDSRCCSRRFDGDRDSSSCHKLVTHETAMRMLV